MRIRGATRGRSSGRVDQAAAAAGVWFDLFTPCLPPQLPAAGRGCLKEKFAMNEKFRTIGREVLYALCSILLSRWVVLAVLVLNSAILVYAKCGCDNLSEFRWIASGGLSVNAYTLGAMLGKTLAKPSDY
jgi:hypothetical protein